MSKNVKKQEGSARDSRFESMEGEKMNASGRKYYYSFA
jgi:hypothetical protein